MVNWYSKGQSDYLAGDFHMAYYIDMNGYDEANYDTQDIEGDGESGDPFMAFGIDTQTWVYGQGQVEFGLLGSHRIRINSSGVRIWTAGDTWVDPLAAGAANLDDLDDVEIDGTPANHEFLIYDSGGNWVNHTASEANIYTKGEVYTQTVINQFLHIGTSNKGTIQLAYEGGYFHEKMRMWADQHNWGNVDGTDFTLHFTSPLPLQLADGKHLHVDYIYVALYDADGNNKLNNLEVYGMSSYSSQSQLYNSTADRTSAGLYSYPTGTDDWGDYHRVTVEVNMVTSNANYWQMRYIEMRYWYA